MNDDWPFRFWQDVPAGIRRNRMLIITGILLFLVGFFSGLTVAVVAGV